jgi:hypothetical protein
VRRDRPEAIAITLLFGIDKRASETQANPGLSYRAGRRSAGWIWLDTCVARPNQFVASLLLFHYTWGGRQVRKVVRCSGCDWRMCRMGAYRLGVARAMKEQR